MCRDVCVCENVHIFHIDVFLHGWMHGWMGGCQKIPCMYVGRICCQYVCIINLFMYAYVCMNPFWWLPAYLLMCVFNMCTTGQSAYIDECPCVYLYIYMYIHEYTCASLHINEYHTPLSKCTLNWRYFSKYWSITQCPSLKCHMNSRTKAQWIDAYH